jgi:RNA polymerase sigma-70 factor (ECF subfamily)
VITAAEQQEVREACGGSLQAFEALVHRYERRVYGFVTQFCREHRDAQEVTQDTFVCAFQALDTFDPSRPFSPWLFTIARRKCVDAYRRRPLPGVELCENLSAPEDAPDAGLAQRDEAGALWAQARRVLSLAQFEVVWLRYAEDMDMAEVAQVLTRTQTHVKVLLFRARRRLADHFAARKTSMLEGLAPPRHPITLNLKANSEI